MKTMCSSSPGRVGKGEVLHAGTLRIAKWKDFPENYKIMESVEKPANRGVSNFEEGGGTMIRMIIHTQISINLQALAQFQ